MKISIVIPTHDRPESLARTVESILAQTRPADELIIAHDGPAALDESLTRRIGQAGIAFRYGHFAPPSSASTRNRGMELAGGDIILMVDDDVLLDPQYLRRLEDMYRLDASQAVAGIGGVLVDPDAATLQRRVWDALAAMLGQNSWRPRRLRARYVELPAGLTGQLVPAGRLSGGALSVRRAVVQAGLRFDESFGGYAYAEDRDFCFRAGVRFALFLAPAMRVAHKPGSTGRPDMANRGRLYVRNSLHIAAHSTEGGCGTWLLVVYDMIGTMVLYSAWSLVSRNRREKLDFVSGMAREILHRWFK